MADINSFNKALAFQIVESETEARVKEPYPIVGAILLERTQAY